ncbi:hypothetical protein B6D06_00595 [Gilliamella apis]|uniref:Uncharacterized protein n=1 Tax=Gilliamella apis TaxID=1970738 RepID=A0A242NYI3_9GAMM|nr:hypothetical protein B6D06_00595 [Gilliamella apis]
MFHHNHWLIDLTHYMPYQYNSILGDCQAGFSVNLNGKVLLSNNMQYLNFSELRKCFGKKTRGI